MFKNDIFPCAPDKSHDSLDGTFAAVGSEDDDGWDGRLEGPMEVCEALDIQHVHLVDKQYAGHELCDSLVDVLVDHLVDLFTQLVWWREWYGYRSYYVQQQK